MKFNKKKKFIIIGLAGFIILASVGVVGALNGWYGGGASIPSDTMTRGLVGYWGMDEGTGQTALDSSGSSNNGTLGTGSSVDTSDPAWTSGKVGSALNFDGVNDYVNLGTTLNAYTTSDITVIFWVKIDGSANNSTLLSNINGVATAGLSLTFNALTLQVFYNPVDGRYDANPVVAANEWTQIAVTYKSNITTLTSYVNGKVFDTDNTKNAVARDAINMYLGARPDNPGPWRYFNGLIDEARIYNRALSAAEVRYHYNRGGPVAQWKFDEGSGTTTYDGSGNNNTGQMQTAASSPTWVQGHSGSALSFDGVNDYVNVPTSSSTEITAAITIGAWVKADNLTSTGDGILFKQSVYGLAVGSSGNIRLDLDVGAGFTAHDSDNSEVAIGTWYYIAGTYDGANWRIYKNGVQVKSGALTGSIQTSANNVKIGEETSSYNWDGLIDDVRIYNYARTADEIALDYNAGFAAKFGYTGSTCVDNPGACMTKGLVGYWGMDEGRGTTAYDSSGNNNNGTLTNGPSWASGKVSSGLSFDGADDHVPLPPNIYGTSAAGAAEMWIYPKAYSTVDGLSKFFAFEGGTYDLMLQFMNGSGQIGFDVWTLNITSGATTVPLNTWSHIVGTWGSNGVRLYINGALVGSSAVTTQAVTNAANGYIARKRTGYGFSGLMDEVRSYTRSLSASEVRYHYNRGGPVGYWKFDEGSGATAFDSSGQANTGTLQNNMATTSWTSGKYGSALNFDGVNDYVSVPDSNSLDITSAITISAWVKPNIAQSGAVSYFMAKSGVTDTYMLDFDHPTADVQGSIRILSGGTVYDSDGPVTIAQGVWQHIVGVYDGTYLRFYVNGIEKSNRNIGTKTITASADPLNIGTYVSATYGFNGLIDDVRIYNYARTQDEIALDYNAGFAAKFGGSANCDLNPGACMTRGLVGQWSMDEGRGTTTADISGNNNTGVFATAASSPAWTSGKVGGGLLFDGSNDYIQALNVGNVQSVEFWLNDSNATDGILELINNATYISIAASAITATGFTSPAIYVNGVATSTFSSGWKHVAITTDTAISAASFLIGEANTDFTAGTIDEVRVYNRALTAAEVRYHHNRGGPVAQWSFNEGSGSVAYDATESHNNGTLQNNMATTSWTSGKYGSALNFDGVNDYVLSANSESDLTTFTVEAWINPSSVSDISKTIISHGASPTDNGWTFERTLSNLRLTLNGVGNYDSNLNILSTNKWQHTVVTLQGTTATFYLDGKQVGITTIGTMIAATHKYSVGATPTPGNFFNGLIDDVRIYNYARTADQILQDYNGGFNIHFK